MKKSSANRQKFTAAAVREEAAEANPHKAARQSMEEESPEELVGGYGHQPLFALVRIILPAEGDVAVGKVYDPVIGNSDAMRVAGQIVENMFRPAEWPFRIRAYQVYLLQERKLGVRTVGLHTAALRFFFCKTLKRAYPVEEVPYPRTPRQPLRRLNEAARAADATREGIPRHSRSKRNSLGHKEVLVTQLRSTQVCTNGELAKKSRYKRKRPIGPEWNADRPSAQSLPLLSLPKQPDTAPTIHPSHPLKGKSLSLERSWPSR